MIGAPLLSVVAFTSNNENVSIYGVADLLSKKGWHLNVLQAPPAIHIACTLPTVAGTQTLLNDLREIVETLKKDPSAGKGDVAAIYGTVASVPDRSVLQDVACGFLDALTMMPKNTRK